MTNILAFSGRKQSGKNTAYNFLLGVTLLRLSVVRGKIEIKDDGKLWVSDLFGDEALAGIARFVEDRSEKIDYFNNNYVYPFIRNYSFADLLKQTVCIDLLGLSWEQCYGTDDQKNSLTHLRWEDMPGVITNKNNWSTYTAAIQEWGLKINEPGQMTAREVMQFTGTEIFRKMYHNVWAQSTVNRILKDESKFAVITDCRFPNEVEAVQKAGGKVIRFNRCPYPDDDHDSETALDPVNYDWNNFDAVIDNSNMSISDQNGAVYKTLESWGWFGGIEMPQEVVSGI